MSYKTARRLNLIADLLEKFIQHLIDAVQLIVIDHTWGKAKYRKRAPRVRPIYQKTVIYHTPRVQVIKEGRVK